MNLKNKIKNYGFWISIASAVILLAGEIFSAMGIEINNAVITSIISGVLSIFVILGIISNPTDSKWYKDEKVTDEQPPVTEFDVKDLTQTIKDDLNQNK